MVAPEQKGLEPEIKLLNQNLSQPDACNHSKMIDCVSDSSGKSFKNTNERNNHLDAEGQSDSALSSSLSSSSTISDEGSSSASGAPVNSPISSSSSSIDGDSLSEEGANRDLEIGGESDVPILSRDISSNNKENKECEDNAQSPPTRSTTREDISDTNNEAPCAHASVSYQKNNKSGAGQPEMSLDDTQIQAQHLPTFQHQHEGLVLCHEYLNPLPPSSHLQPIQFHQSQPQFGYLGANPFGPPQIALPGSNFGYSHLTPTAALYTAPQPVNYHMAQHSHQHLNHQINQQHYNTPHHQTRRIRNQYQDQYHQPLGQVGCWCCAPSINTGPVATNTAQDRQEESDANTNKLALNDQTQITRNSSQSKKVITTASIDQKETRSRQNSVSSPGSNSDSSSSPSSSSTSEDISAYSDGNSRPYQLHYVPATRPSQLFYSPSYHYQTGPPIHTPPHHQASCLGLMMVSRPPEMAGYSIIDQAQHQYHSQPDQYYAYPTAYVQPFAHHQLPPMIYQATPVTTIIPPGPIAIDPSHQQIPTHHQHVFDGYSDTAPVPSDKLLSMLPIDYELTRTRQAYGMDKVWSEEFERLFCQLSLSAGAIRLVWNLMELETNPSIRRDGSIVGYKGRYIVDVSRVDNGAISTGSPDMPQVDEIGVPSSSCSHTCCRTSSSCSSVSGDNSITRDDGTDESTNTMSVSTIESIELHTDQIDTTNNCPSIPRKSETGDDRRTIPTKFRMFIDSAKVRFCCDNCGHGWTSMKGRVVFWYELFELSGVGVLGYCGYKLFGQQCDVCKVDNRFERPMWYPEEVSKVLNNLYNKIGQVYFGFKMPAIDKQRRAGKPKTSHNTSLCQACLDGVCTDRK